MATAKEVTKMWPITLDGVEYDEKTVRSEEYVIKKKKWAEKGIKIELAGWTGSGWKLLTSRVLPLKPKPEPTPEVPPAA